MTRHQVSIATRRNEVEAAFLAPYSALDLVEHGIKMYLENHLCK